MQELRATIVGNKKIKKEQNKQNTRAEDNYSEDGSNKRKVERTR